MKQRFVLLLLVCSLLFFPILSIKQTSAKSIVAPPIEWQSTVGGFKVEQTSDGGYILFGSGRLTKLDSFGALEWTQTYSTEFHSGDQCLDGGYVLAGSHSFLKTDETGAIQWERNYEEEGFSNSFKAVQQSSDGGYVLAGLRVPFGVNDDDFLLVKTDSSGNIEWKKTYGDESGNEMAYDVLQASDGGYILVGEQFRFDYVWTDGWVVKTDINGNMVWSKSYGEPDLRGDWLYSVSPTNNDGYIMAGCGNRDAARSRESGDFWLLQIDNSGNQQWSRYFGKSDSHESASSVKPTDDGCFIAVGVIRTGVGIGDTWVIKTDPFDSSIVWDKIIEGTGSGDDVIQTEDRGFAVAAGPLFKIMRANPPVSIFNYYPTSPTVREEIFFNASSSYDLDEDITSYLWNFADGNILPTPNSTISHSFESPGNYSVKLTVRDSEYLNSSYSQTILVKINTSISISPNSVKNFAGKPIDFTGTLRDAYGNALRNENISIYYSVVGKESWTQIVNETTDSLGNFFSTWSHSNPRNYSIKVEWPGNQTFYGTSNTTNIQILHNPTLLSMSLSSSSTTFGFKVGINGNLISNSVGLGGFPIRLSYSVTGGQTWNDISMIITDSEGKYSVEWMPSATGVYIVKGLWTGNSSYPQTTVTANLAVISFEEQTVFSVASNSTVSSLAFNSTSKELRFTLSGVSGSIGYVDASISKTLIDNIYDVQVYLNESELDYDAISLDDSWLLHFTYNHSTHEVVISLTGASTTFELPINDLLPFLLVLIVIVLCIIILYLANRKR